MNDSADVSVEFSHVYSDQELGDTQLRSLRRARRARRHLESQGKTVLSLILLDDIHVSQSLRSAEDIKKEIEHRGGQVDAVIRESDVVHGVDTFLRGLCSTRLKLESFRTPRRQVVFLNVGTKRIALGTRSKGVFIPTCALLSAVWHVARLGEICVPGIPSASTSLTILEERYRELEQKALAIIQASAFRDAISKIEHVFL
jgi:hypothetical protein